MRRYLTLFLLLGSLFELTAQEARELTGSVSYTTSQNVYVRFSSTEGISEGDTLFLTRDGKSIPAMVVTNLSSISVVCTPLGGMTISTGDVVTAQTIILPAEEPQVTEPALGTAPTIMPEATATVDEKQRPILKQQVSGRIGITSYSRFTNQEDAFSQRMRYNVSLNVSNISNSRLSAESHIAFSHRDEQWELIKSNVYEGLKIYNLALRYDISENSVVSLGRKFNPRISSIGAIDGLQYEHRFGDFAAGAIVGSRPDYEDYSYNASLFQAGAYFSHEKKEGSTYLQSSVALVEQQNGGNTDRRFLYIQHANKLLKQLYFFGSGEFDLYTVKETGPENTFSMTNTYLSLRYDPFNKLRLSASYSARNNIIYYETYKSLIDKLLELETVQGFRLAANYRPVNNLSVGIQAGYRSRPADIKASRNIYAYISRTDLPWIHVTATLSATLLETSYINGRVYGINLTRDLIKGKLFGSASYRYTDYDLYGEIATLQHVGELSLNLRLTKGLSFSVSDEATFDGDYRYHRLFLSLRQKI